VTHAADAVLELHAQLLRLYPGLPTCALVGDEPAGDFGIAHYLGLSLAGCARMTFDVGYAPRAVTKAHELGHAWHDNTGGDPRVYHVDDPVLKRWHEAVGYTVPLAEIIARGEASDDWGALVGEQLAQAFAYIALGLVFPRAGNLAGMWQRYGGRPQERREQVAALFVGLLPRPDPQTWGRPIPNLRGGDDDMFSEQDRAILMQAAADAAAARRLAQEAYDKANAIGVVLPTTWLRRLFWGRDPLSGLPREKVPDDGS
jgi:hypothetical protein